MAVYKPGRLHRKLSPNGLPLFSLSIGPQSYGDSDIHEITVNRGNNGPLPDLTPSTFEFSVSGAPDIPRDSVAKLELAPWFADLVATYGPSSATVIRPRFTGRKGASYVTDKSYKAGDLSKTDWSTRVVCSSWSSVLRVAKRTTSPTAGINLGTVLANAINHPATATMQPASVFSSANYDTVYATDPNLTFSEVAEKYGTGLGILLQHLRDGRIMARPPTNRLAQMTLGLASKWPVLRSQGISPAEWSQPIDSAGAQYLVKRRDSAGAAVTDTWPLPDGAAPVVLDTEEIDLLHIKPRTLNYEYYVNARNNDTNRARMELNQLTIDLVHLLSSPKEVDRRVGQQFLALEAGDPIYLSGDWPQAIRAPYFANQVTETVTSDSWEMVVDLYHPRDVLGLYDGDVPVVKPKVWDSAIGPWDDMVGQWNDY